LCVSVLGGLSKRVGYRAKRGAAANRRYEDPA